MKQNSLEGRKDIDAIELIESRGKEIQFIEESIKKSNKKTMLFQRLPFYKRRRNRNYDKRKSKKFTYRKKDRHFLRSHTYYAKRFFMLKLDIKGDIVIENFLNDSNIQILEESKKNNNISPNFINSDKASSLDYNNVSVPLKRRIKSSKYIYKSQDRGFLFDESFRCGYSYPTDELVEKILKIASEDYQISQKAYISDRIPTLSKISLLSLAQSLDLDRFDQVQIIDNIYEVILTKTYFYIIGAWIYDCEIPSTPLSGILSIFKKENYGFYELKNIKNAKVFPVYNNSIQTHKILCDRSEIMNIFQLLINNSIIPICLEELHRLSFEHNQMTVYDNIQSNLYKQIEYSINKEIIEKYNRTPKSKRVEIITDDLFISNDPKLFESTLKCYFIFKVEKGNVEKNAFVFLNNQIIGRVIRGAYKFSNGKCYGLCVIYSEYLDSVFNILNLNIKISNEEGSEDFQKQEQNDENLNLLSVKNLGKNNFYKIKLVKSIL